MANYQSIEKARQALPEIQKNARVRKIQDSDIEKAITLVELELAKRLYKKDWAGITARVDLNAQKFPGAYKSTPESTIICLQRTATTWRMEIVRAYTDSRAVRINYPGTCAEAMLQFAQDQA